MRAAVAAVALLAAAPSCGGEPDAAGCTAMACDSEVRVDVASLGLDGIAQLQVCVDDVCTATGVSGPAGVETIVLPESPSGDRLPVRLVAVDAGGAALDQWEADVDVADAYLFANGLTCPPPPCLQLDLRLVGDLLVRA